MIVFANSHSFLICCFLWFVFSRSQFSKDLPTQKVSVALILHLLVLQVLETNNYRSRVVRLYFYLENIFLGLFFLRLLFFRKDNKNFHWVGNTEFRCCRELGLLFAFF